MTHITVSLLRKFNACPEQVELFERIFGSQAELTPENWDRAIAEDLDVHWLENILPDEKKEEYLKIPAREEYLKITRPAWEKYLKIQQAAYEKYQKITRPAWLEYRSIQQAAYEKYQKIQHFAWEDYQKIRQSVLFEILKSL